MRQPLGFFTAALPELPLPTVLGLAQHWQLSALELGVGGYPGTAHADALALREEPDERRRLRQLLKDHPIRHLVLSCHSNPLHPDPESARQADQVLHATLELAHEWSVDTVVAFSGAASSGSVLNWPVAPWPEEYPSFRARIWADQLIPYWQGVEKRADQLGVNIALEMHGGFLVHSPGTLLELRQACGNRIGANLDPSHFWWQGLDPLAGIRLLGDALFHVHLKDWQADPEQQALWGLLDPRPMTTQPRAWQFRVPGRGHDHEFWQPFLETLSEHRFTGMLSVEHEDPDLPAREGIAEAIRFIRSMAGS